MNVIVKGSHYVGETTVSKSATVSRGKQDEWVFEDEDHLEDTLSGYKRDEAQAQRERAEFRAYLYANAARRREENNYHQARPDFDPCPNCGVCRCGRGRPQTFECRCAQGQKRIGTDRLAFLNNALKQSWSTTLWEVGIGVAPKKHQNEKTTALQARGLE